MQAVRGWKVFVGETGHEIEKLMVARYWDHENVEKKKERYFELGEQMKQRDCSNYSKSKMDTWATRLGGLRHSQEELISFHGGVRQPTLTALEFLAPLFGSIYGSVTRIKNRRKPKLS